MKTDDLIRAMSQDKTLARPVWADLLIWVAPGAFIALVALLLGLGARPDLALAMAQPVSVMRFVLSLSLAVVAFRAVLAFSRPDGDGRTVWSVMVVPAISAVLWILTWLEVPPEARQMAIVGKTMVSCLVTIPALSVLPVGAIFIALRRAAPTRPSRTGALAGLAGGGLAAAIYAIHCTEDSPLFYVTWYGLAILFVTLVSAWAGTRLLRW